MGSFVGTPNNIVIYQNNLHGLPLQLIDEECLFLLNECDCQLVEHCLNDQIIDRCVNEMNEFENRFQNDFASLNYQNWIKKIKERLDHIVEGKAKKRNLSIDQLDREQILNEEIKRIETIEINQPKQLLISSPWSIGFKSIDFNSNDFNSNDLIDKRPEQIKIPKLRTEHALLRYLTYKDLNKKGLYLTKGNKFGSDFLAYPTDPLFCHAQYMVLCLDQQLCKTHLHFYTRLGSQVNKDVLLVRFKDDKKTMDSDLDYMVIKWQSDI